MTCPLCQGESSGPLQYCQSCLAERQAARMVSMERMKLEHSTITTGRTALFGSKQFLIAVGVMVFSSLAWGGQLFGPRQLPPTAELSGSVSSDPCAGRERCIVVYVAPWCPACEGALPFFNFLYRKVQATDRVGMKVIIGADEQSKLVRMSGKFRAPTFFDEDGSFSRAAGVRAYPSVWVTDGEGGVLRRGLPGAVSGGEDEEANFRYYNHHYLQLKDYLK
jgi:thiol-disulfide isomerase/thioredoxin